MIYKFITIRKNLVENSYAGECEGHNNASCLETQPAFTRNWIPCQPPTLTTASLLGTAVKYLRNYLNLTSLNGKFVKTIPAFVTVAIAMHYCHSQTWVDFCGG